MTKESQNNSQSNNQKYYRNQIGLAEGENNLPRYNKSIVMKFAKYFEFDQNSNAKNKSILDFGAGIGSLSHIFQELHSISPICIEVDPNFVKILGAKGFEVFKSTKLLQSKFEFVYTSNVLEHIEDDIEALTNLNMCMRSNGKLAIYVPAFPSLFSELDRKVGHFRRYSRKELIYKVKAAGFQVDKCFYGDSLGVLATLSLKVFGYRNKLGLGQANSLIIYDRLIYPISKILDFLGCRFFIGKNLYLFAHKV